MINRMINQVEEVALSFASTDQVYTYALLPLLVLVLVLVLLLLHV